MTGHTKESEEGQAEKGRKEDGHDHLIGLQSELVRAQQATDARCALAEEEVTHDGTNDCQPGRDAETGEYRRHRRR